MQGIKTKLKVVVLQQIGVRRTCEFAVSCEEDENDIPGINISISMNIKRVFSEQVITFFEITSTEKCVKIRNGDIFLLHCDINRRITDY